ncbi:MAG: YqiA/YcfP family alpha/beta fold hydrolase [Candidatus Aminicenantes bacterium]|jgi:predicted esterase YcpF (UPF0227 family)
MIFYFHGFASSERSWKVDLLKKQLTSETIIAPTLPVDPAEVVKLFEQVVTENGKPGLVIGSSLGGFYAYYAASRFDTAAALINPSITPWVTLKDHIGIHKRYYTGEPFEWKVHYLDTLKKINDKINNDDPKHHRLHFFLSADDEVLDFSAIPSQFTAAGSIRFYDNCGHAFNRFAEIIPEIEKLLGY